MKTIIRAAIAIALLASPAVLSAASLDGPKAQWVCWYSSPSRPSCGTFGWSSSRQVAAESALSLCTFECGACQLDYCEQE